MYRDLWSGVQRFLLSDPSVLSDNAAVLVEKVRSEDFVLFSSEQTSVSMFGQDCDIEVVKAGVKSVMMSLNLPKGSALAKPLNDV